MLPLNNGSTLDRQAGQLRQRISQLRENLDATTAAYRLAAVQHDSSKSIALLRARSRFMRELLDAQCELLLHLRSGGAGGAQEIPAPNSEATAPACIGHEQPSGTTACSL